MNNYDEDYSPCKSMTPEMATRRSDKMRSLIHGQNNYDEDYSHGKSITPEMATRRSDKMRSLIHGQNNYDEDYSHGKSITPEMATRRSDQMRSLIHGQNNYDEEYSHCKSITPEMATRRSDTMRSLIHGQNNYDEDYSHCKSMTPEMATRRSDKMRSLIHGQADENDGKVSVTLGDKTAQMAFVVGNDSSNNPPKMPVPPVIRKPRGNQYASRKTFAQGLMDVALLMANANQLKSMITLGPSQPFFYPNIILISISILLQMIVGLVLIVLGTLEGKTDEEKRHMVVLNEISVGLVFGVTIVNIFITAFGIKSG